MQKLPFKKVVLDARQRRLWEDTLAAMNWIGPGFVHIMCTMLANTGDNEEALFTEDIKFAAATDGYQIILKPSEFFKRNLMKRAFMMFHEIMHEILMHCHAAYHYQKTGKIVLAGRDLPYDPEFANIVQDLIINAILIMSKFGEFDEAWLFDKDLNAHEKDWINLYFELWRKAEQQARTNPRPGQGKPGEGKPGQGKPGEAGKPGQGTPGKNGTQATPPLPGAGKQRFDGHLEPGESKGKDAHEMPERNQAAWEQAINTAMEIQRAHGKLPASMEHFFQSVLKPNVEWSDHVRGEITRISGSGAYSWQKLDRRLLLRGVGAPSVTGHSCDVIVVGCDSSGSIFVDKTLLDRFVHETAGILEDVNPREVHFVVCDAELQGEYVLHDVDDLRRMKVIKGGGGTSFIPVFDYIDKHGLEPDALIYLTDGDGTFPAHEPDYPVIWGDISGQPAKYKFGKVVFIPTTKD